MLTNTFPGKPTFDLAHQRGVAVDHARLLERAHAPQARRLAQVDLVRQVTVADASVPLQFGQDAPGRCGRVSLKSSGDADSCLQAVLLHQEAQLRDVFCIFLRRRREYPRPIATTLQPRGEQSCASAYPRKSRSTNTVSASCRPRPENWSRQDTKSRCRPAARRASASPMRTTSASARRSRRRPRRSSTSREMIVKVKEPQPKECAQLHKGQVLYTYLHLAPDPKQTEALVKSGATCIAYETVTAPDGSLPLLTPMSEVAGRMSVQVGAYYLQKAQRRPRDPARRRAGRGAAQGRHPRRRRRRARTPREMAVGLRADVTVVDRSMKRLRELSSIFGATLRTEYSTQRAHRRTGDRGRPGDRRRADRRRRGAEARHRATWCAA